MASERRVRGKDSQEQGLSASGRKGGCRALAGNDEVPWEWSPAQRRAFLGAVWPEGGEGCVDYARENTGKYLVNRVNPIPFSSRIS